MSVTLRVTCSADAPRASTTATSWSGPTSLSSRRRTASSTWTRKHARLPLLSISHQLSPESDSLVFRLLVSSAQKQERRSSSFCRFPTPVLLLGEAPACDTKQYMWRKEAWTRSWTQGQRKLACEMTASAACCACSALWHSLHIVARCSSRMGWPSSSLPCHWICTPHTPQPQCL